MMEHASTEATVKTKLTKAELKRMKKAGVFSAVLPVERSDFKKYSATLERKTRKPTEEKWCAIDLMGTAMVVGVKWIPESLLQNFRRDCGLRLQPTSALSIAAVRAGDRAVSG